MNIHNMPDYTTYIDGSGYRNTAQLSILFPVVLSIDPMSGICYYSAMHNMSYQVSFLHCQIHSERGLSFP